MTLREVIDRIDDLKPNTYEETYKARWISELDARIYNEVFLTHEGNPYTREEPPEEETEIPEPEETPEGTVLSGIPVGPKKIYLKLPYTIEEASETTLLAEFPYDELYVAYLEAKIDEYNQETARYNNSSTKFNNLYTEYCSWYNRLHMPIERGRRRVPSEFYRNPDKQR